VLTDILHDADLTNLRALDHPEVQIAVDAVTAHDGDEDDAAFAEIALMQGEGRRGRIGRTLAARFLAHEATDPVAGFPRGEFPGEACGRLRLAVAVGHERAERCDVEDEGSGHDLVS